MFSIHLSTVKEVFGILLVFTGLFDAFKYSLQAFKIQQAQSAKVQSRKFVLMAVGNDLVKIVYSILIMDIYIFLSSLLALICMIHLWVTVWRFYNYKYRGLSHFKRPNIVTFTINAMIPNNLRKHL